MEGEGGKLRGKGSRKELVGNILAWENWGRCLVDGNWSQERERKIEIFVL